MTYKTQPEALRLADHLERFRSFPDDLAAAAELRRLHAEVERLSEALRGWWEAYRPVGWTEDQHRSCPHVNLATATDKALADAMLRAREASND